MTLLKILGIDRYTAKFKEWIRNKFIAKGGLKTINGEPIEGEGDIEISGGGSSATPDWDAQEGEYGYINNRICYLKNKLGSLNSNVYIETDMPYYYYNYVYVKYNLTLKEIKVDFDNNVMIINGPPVYLKFEKGVNNGLKITLIDSSGYFESKELYIFGEIIKLNEVYIPSTVVKTTPQTLTTSDKKQARENISAQEKLVSGVNVATINGESILGRNDIRINETIDLSNIITSRPSSTTEPIIVEINGGSDYNYIYSLDFHKIFIKTVNEITLNRYNGNEIHFSYAGRTFPTYDYDHVIVYYNAPNYLLVCEAFSDQYNGVYNCIRNVKFTLNKIN